MTAEIPTGLPSTHSDPPMSEERPHALTPIVQIWIMLVAVAFFVGKEFVQNGGKIDQPFSLTDLPIGLIIFVSIGVISLGFGIWTWWTTRFVISPSEFRVEHRGFTHESKRIAYQRIQAVDITQPFAARLLGLAQLTIDAGGDSTKIQYLSRLRATAMRDELLARAHGTGLEPSLPPHDLASAESIVSTTDVPDHEKPQQTAVPSVTTHVTVRPGELALGAVLSHELLWMVLFGVASVVFSVVIEERAILTVLIPTGLGILGFLSKRTTSQFNFTLADSTSGLRVTSGLTSLTSSSVPVHRIQAIRVHEPVLWRRIGRARVDFAALRLQLVENEDSGSSTTLLPIGKQDDVVRVIQAVWPDLRLDLIKLHPAPRKARWLAPLGFRWIALGWDDHVVVSRNGWWTRTTWIIPHARLQSANATQGPLARRLGLSRVSLHPAGLSGFPTTILSEFHARQFVFAEMVRAKIARFDEGLGRR